MRKSVVKLLRYEYNDGYIHISWKQYKNDYLKLNWIERTKLLYELKYPYIPTQEEMVEFKREFSMFL